MASQYWTRLISCWYSQDQMKKETETREQQRWRVDGQRRGWRTTSGMKGNVADEWTDGQSRGWRTMSLMYGLMNSRWTNSDTGIPFGQLMNGHLEELLDLWRTSKSDRRWKQSTVTGFVWRMWRHTKKTSKYHRIEPHFKREVQPKSFEANECCYLLFLLLFKNVCFFVVNSENWQLNLSRCG